MLFQKLIGFDDSAQLWLRAAVPVTRIRMQLLRALPEGPCDHREGTPVVHPERRVRIGGIRDLASPIRALARSSSAGRLEKVRHIDASTTATRPLAHLAVELLEAVLHELEARIEPL